ncbi:hypothetical protein C8R46DRAFT_1362489 [Mycena filopes]|nr:hypothetical protein C8R46DRAFT_1362489 [Mycena filopes]
MAVMRQDHRQTITMSEILPSELWLEIFNGLTRTTLANLALTHRFLHQLTRPLLFAKCTLRPYCTTYDEEHEARILHCSLAQEAESLARYEFWAAEDIAPLVRECYITPTLLSRRDYRGMGNWTHEYPVLETLFLHLSRFSGLQTLHTADVRPSPAVIATALSRSLPALEELRIVTYVVVDPQDTRGGDSTTDPTICLSLSRFTLVQTLAGVPDPLDLRSVPWLRFLDHARLRALDVSGPSAHAVHDELARGATPFRAVDTLALTLATTPSKPQMLTILTQFPRLRALALATMERYKVGGWNARALPWDTGTLGWNADDDEVDTVGLLPALTQYSGPVTTIPTFVGVPTLTTLGISAPPSTPADLLRVLGGMRRLPANITALTLDLDLDDRDTDYAAACDALGRVFADVRQIDVRVTVSGLERQPPSPHSFVVLFDLAEDSRDFPKAVQRLAHAWTVARGVVGSDHPDCEREGVGGERGGIYDVGRTLE